MRLKNCFFLFRSRNMFALSFIFLSFCHMRIITTYELIWGPYGYNNLTEENGWYKTQNIINWGNWIGIQGENYIEHQHSSTTNFYDIRSYALPKIFIFF